MNLSEADGRAYGREAAGHLFEEWERVGPPYPWPTGREGVDGFAEEIAPYVESVVAQALMQNLARTGLDPLHTPLPRVFLSGAEQGCLDRLRELVRKRVPD